MTFFLKSLAFIFFIPLLGIAQSNYKPGYVVLLTGDTLRGTIDFKDWDKNPKTISFRSAANGSKSTKYNAGQIRYLDLDTLGAYQQFIGPITMDVTEESHLLNGRDSSYKLDTVLLRVLQKGSRITLLSYSDQLKTRFYIQQPSDKVPQELAYRVYYDVGQSASGRTINENTYMRQLFAIGQQYNVMNKSLQWDIEHSRYDETSLLKISSKINQIPEGDRVKTTPSKQKKYKLAFALIAFVVIAKLVLSGSHFK